MEKVKNSTFTEKDMMHFCGLYFLVNLDKKTFQLAFSIFEFCLCNFEVDLNFDLYQVKNAINAWPFKFRQVIWR